MNRPLVVSVIGKNKETITDVIAVINRSNINHTILSFSSVDVFIKNKDINHSDLIVEVLTPKNQKWKKLFNYFAESEVKPFVINILPDGADTELASQMLGEGAYDVIEFKVLPRLNVLLSRIARIIYQAENRNLSSLEKNISDNILHNSRSMLTVINRDYVYEKANSKFCDAHHTNQSIIEGKSLAEVWGHDNFRENIKEKLDSCFLGKTVHYEASFQIPSLGKRYFDVSFRPVRSGKNPITHLIAETFDITDIKLARQAYDDIEKEFKEMETNIPIGYLRCDITGTILHVNKAFLRILEFDEEGSIIGNSLKSLYVEESLFKIHLEQILYYNSKTFSRVSFKTGKGNEIPCRLTAILVSQKSKKIPYIDFSFEDSSRELILETRLLQAQKLETIGSLAGGLAHDFNNILATIYGYSELIQSEISESSPVSEKIGRIITAVARARSLTNQILTFSRQVEQEKIAVNIWNVLKETIDFVKAGVPANIMITDNVKKTNATVFADPTQLFRVFLNLMTNSVQAMEGQNGTLIIDLSVVNGKKMISELNRDIVADEYALVSFSDNGVGMDPSIVNRIFEPFFTTRDTGKGTGLGLSVVHGIISEIEGEIVVTSKKGIGTTFRVYIPLSKDPSGTEKRSFSSKEILFISGNNHESRILSLALENSGFKLMHVSDYVKLSKIFRDNKHKPDLIIFMDESTDFNKGNLIDLLLQKKLNIPVLLITDYEHCFLDEKTLNSGIIKHQLIKPVSLKEVRTAIQLSLKY